MNEDRMGVYSTFNKQIVHNSLYGKQASLRKWHTHMEWNHFEKIWDIQMRSLEVWEIFIYSS